MINVQTNIYEKNQKWRVAAYIWQVKFPTQALLIRSQNHYPLH